MTANMSDMLTQLEHDMELLRIENERLQVTTGAQVREISMLRDLNVRLMHERDRNLVKLTELRSLLSLTSSGLVEGLKRMQVLDDERRNIPDAEPVAIKPKQNDLKGFSTAELLPQPSFGEG